VITLDNKSYWEKRQLKNYLTGEKTINDYYTGLKKSFEQSKREIEKVINDFVMRYGVANQSPSYVTALRRLNKTELGELQDFIDKVNEHMGEYNLEVENLSIKARITRYQALQKQIDALLQELYAVEYEYKGTEKQKEIYSESYYRTWFNIDQYKGFHAEFAQINIKAIEELIKYPFDGADFSTRLWKQKDYMLQQLSENITTMLIQGRNPNTLSKDFAKKFETREFEAYRLLQTESSYIIEQASQAAYKEDDVEKYQWLATLDLRTCELCAPLDNKIFKVGEGIVGKTLTPRHALCRCTTVPYYDDTELEEETRIARNKKTNKNYTVPANVSYEEWKKKYI
jgi:SPP1 gp7 family putative phage head morphogenesis protein